MKKYIKFFVNPIEDRERFLNEMASKGLQLEESGSLVHKFSESSHSNRHYTVQYIGNINSKERQDYMNFVQNLNLKVFFAPFNIGKFVIGSARFRPFNKGTNAIATAPGMMNREIMIIESEGDEKITIFTDDESRYKSLRERRTPFLYLAVASLILIILGLTQSQGSFFEATVISFRPLEKFPFLWVIAGFILMIVSIVNLYRLHRIVNKK